MRKLFWFAAVAASLVSVEGRAEVTRNIELSGFDPTPSTIGTSFQLLDPGVGRVGDLVLSSSLSHAYNLFALDSAQDDNWLVRHRTMFVLGGAYVLRGHYEIGARMPFFQQSGDPLMPPSSTTFSERPASGTALGDLAIHGKMPVWRSGAWNTAAAAILKLPTSTDGEFAGTSLPSLRGVMAASFVATKTLTLLANAGFILRRQDQYANAYQGSGLSWGLGATYRTSQAMFVDLEAYGDVIPGGRKNESQDKGTQLTGEALLGARYQATRQMSLGFALGRGLTGGAGEPAVRGVFTFTFAPSARPLPPFEKKRDTTPEVDPNTNDADFDRLVDAADKCPNEREDKDGFEDEDGCPDLDNDKDGVADAQDKCVDKAEDHDGFDDLDGCPDDDNDKDGVADAKDKCPRDAETINGVKDDDGCPDRGESLVISTPDRLEMMVSVEFNGTAVAKNSANLLGQLATTLRARTDIRRLRIGVHVQPTKSSAQDQTLSDKRGAAIRDWLVERGIDRNRIDPRGFGGTKPLVPSTQKGAAAINDRVELIILDRK